MIPVLFVGAHKSILSKTVLTLQLLLFTMNQKCTDCSCVTKYLIYIQFFTFHSLCAVINQYIYIISGKFHSTITNFLRDTILHKPSSDFDVKNVSGDQEKL